MQFVTVQQTWKITSFFLPNESKVFLCITQIIQPRARPCQLWRVHPRWPRLGPSPGPWARRQWPASSTLTTSTSRPSPRRRRSWGSRPPWRRAITTRRAALTARAAVPTTAGQRRPESGSSTSSWTSSRIRKMLACPRCRRCRASVISPIQTRVSTFQLR